jgi:hypothetical protein
MNARLSIILGTALVLQCICSAQVSSTPPRNWKSVAPVSFGFGSSRLELSHNSPDAIRQELLDSNTVRLIAASSGLKDTDLATVQIAPGPDNLGIGVYQLGNSDRAFTILSDEIRRYAQARLDGHTRDFVLAMLTNRVAPSTISDPDLRVIAANRTWLPVSWLKRVESGTSTNKAGQIRSRATSITVVDGKSVTNETTHIQQADEVCRWVLYMLVDGEVAWQYSVRFKADGSLDDISDSRCDPKEYDPKYVKMVKEVDDEVDAEMKRDGSFGQFGSVHTFWHLKKEKLKAKGIDWRSPSELNPNTIYD